MAVNAENLKIILSAVDNASRVLKSVSKNIEKTKKDFSKATAGARTFTKGVGLLAGITGGLAVKEFASFEKQMSKVKAITGASNEEYKKMTDLAKKMGSTTAFTAKEAGDALEYLGMAGLSVQESMDALPGALELASAGNLSLGEAADIATNIMAQFGIKAKDIGRVNDVLAKSATSANTSVTEMAEAMKYMGPVANSMKVPLEETAAAIDILANNGIKGGMAGQSFSASLLRITKPTKQMKKSMDALNLTLFDSQGRYVGLTETVRQLEEGTKNLTDEEKAKHIATVFGIQSTKQWLTLLKDGSGEMKKYTKALQNSKGAAKEMAKTQLDNLAGSFTLLKSAISGAMIEIGGAISTHLRPAIDWLTDKISNWKTEWESLSPVTKSLIKALGIIAGSLTAIGVAVGAVSIVVMPLMSAFTFLTTVLSGLGTALAFVGGAFASVGLPIVLLIGSIMALGVVIYKFYKNWDDIMLVIQYLTKKMKDKVIEIWEKLKTGVSAIIESVKTWISNKWTAIKDGIKTILGAIKNIFVGAFTFYKNLVVAEFNFIKKAIGVAFNFIKTIIVGAWNFVKRAFINAFTFYKNLVVNSFNFIKGAIIRGFTAIKTGVVTSLNFIKGIFTSVFGTIKQGILVSFDYIKNIFSNGLGFIKNIWTNSFETMKNFGSSVWNSIKSFIGGAIDVVSNKFQSFYNRVAGIYNKVKGWLNAIFGGEKKAQQSASNIRRVANTTGAGSLDGARAIGGPVTRNKTYLVGENGPEYFTPGTTGRITPNTNGNGGNTPNITLNFGDVVLNNGDDEVAFFQKVENAIIEIQRRSANGLT